MQKISLITIISVLWVAMLLAGEVLAYDYGPLYNKVTLDVSSPHIRWAKPYYKGEIRVLVIAQRWFTQRETVELAQRLSLDYETVMPFKADQWGANPGDAYVVGIKGTSEEEVLADLREKLERPYDVIIVNGFYWNLFPADIELAIFKKVAAGTGLVVTSPTSSYTKTLKRVLEQKTEEKAGFLKEGITYNPGKGILALSKLKNGRVAIINYDPDLTPFSLPYQLNYEIYQSLFIKAILWAGKQEPDIMIKLTASPLNLTLTCEKGRTVTVEMGTISDMGLVPTDGLGISNFLTKRVELQPGENSIPVLLPSLKAGLHFITVFLKEDGKIINWAIAPLTVETEERIKRIVLDKECYNRGETVRGEVFLKPIGQEQRKLIIQLIDNYGRIVAENILSLNSKTEKTDFTLKLEKNPLSILFRVKASLVDGSNNIIDEAWQEFTVPDRTLDDFYFNMWANLREGFTYSVIARQLARYGVDIVSDHTGGFRNLEEMAKSAALFNMRNIWMRLGNEVLWGGLDFRESSAKDLIRTPCLTDPRWKKEVDFDLLRAQIKEMKKYGPVSYNITHEGAISVITPLDLCFSPTCQESFRNYLKDVYGDLKSLNNEWDTNFKDWREVAPITLSEAKKTGQYARWVDFRKSMEKVWIGVTSEVAEIIKKVDPEARAGFDGGSVSWYSGWNWWEMSKRFQHFIVYGRDFEIIRSFAPPDSFRSGFYGAYRSNLGNKNYQIFPPWDYLFHGFNAASYFNSYWYEQSAFAPDGSPFPFFLDAVKELEEIKGGLGKLLLSSQRMDDKIAIHYSQSSLYASAIFPEPTTIGASQENFRYLLEDLGLQYKYVSYEEIEQGKLMERGYKVLILPYSQSLSQKEAEEIERFVREGGMVIADLRPGIMDEHGKLLQKGLLDNLFGIKREFLEIITDENKISIRKEGGKLGFKGEFLSSSIESGISTTTGEALAEAEGKPVLIVNRYGKGQAVLLNFALDKYRESESKKVAIEERKEIDPLMAALNNAKGGAFGYKGFRKFGRGNVLRDLMRKVLESGDVKSRIKLKTADGDLKACETVFFRGGDIEYVGLLPDMEVDDLTAKSVEITFPKKSHLYDVRKGRYYGFTDRVNTDIVPGRAELYAMVPYEIKGIELNLGSKSYKQGGLVDYKISIDTSGPAPSRHAVRLEVYDSEGNKVKHYARNILVEQGLFKGELHIALNDKPGNWKMVVKEIVSGRIAEGGFEIIP